MKAKKSIEEQVNKVFLQCKESLKALQSLEKQTLERAKGMVKKSDLSEQVRLTNDRILGGLKKMGVATQSEVTQLENKIAKLETALAEQNKKKATRTRAASTAKPKVKPSAATASASK